MYKRVIFLTKQIATCHVGEAQVLNHHFLGRPKLRVQFPLWEISNVKCLDGKQVLGSTIAKALFGFCHNNMLTSMYNVLLLDALFALLEAKSSLALAFPLFLTIDYVENSASIKMFEILDVDS